MDIRTLVQSAGASVASTTSGSGAGTTSATPTATFTPRTVETESLKVKGSSGLAA